MFCANRNFTIIEKRKYGLYIRMLPVEDKDIELVMPLIKESFYKTKYPAFDIKNGLNQFYVEDY